jgi:hypothetical protein
MVCLAPVIIAAWPAITSWVVGAATVMGFTAVSDSNRERAEVGTHTEEVELELGSTLEGYISQQQQFMKDGVIFTIKTNERGRLLLQVKGNKSRKTLEEMAKGFAGKMLQAYSYHKAMTQLRQTGFTVVFEKMEQDEQIHVKLRRY